MCRFLLVASRRRFDSRSYLDAFADVCRSSREYQGDGWGISLRSGCDRRVFRSVGPIWEADLAAFGRAELMVVHARSAFRDSPITIDQTMPFGEGDMAFVFNGELHDVRLKSPGANGAQKIFSFVGRLSRTDPGNGFSRAVKAIRKATGHLRAMNLIFVEGRRISYSSIFEGEEDYFTLHRIQDAGRLVVCSEVLPGFSGWIPIANNTVEVTTC